jgi:hypothetical protein
MFDFLFDAPYEERKVDRYEAIGLTVDTCSVNDGEHPYETAVAHKEYDSGEWIIVEAYDTKEEAQVGHDKWVKIMTTEPLPEKLVDCNNSEISKWIGDTVIVYRTQIAKN